MKKENDKQFVTYRSFRTSKKLENGRTVLDTSGAITACCNVDLEKNTMHVGFSFLNPTDNQLKPKGRGIAKQRMLKNPILFPKVPADEKGAPRISTILVDYLKKVTEIPNDSALFAYLGIQPYNGAGSKCEFMSWFPAMIKSL